MGQLTTGRGLQLVPGQLGWASRGSRSLEGAANHIAAFSAIMIVWAFGLPRGMTGMAQPDNNPSPFGPTNGSITGLIRSQRAGTDHTRHLTVVWVGPAAACARCCWPVRARMVGAAALSSMVKARAAASNATAAAVTNAQWYAESCGVRWPRSGGWFR